MNNHYSKINISIILMSLICILSITACQVKVNNSDKQKSIKSVVADNSDKISNMQSLVGTWKAKLDGDKPWDFIIDIVYTPNESKLLLSSNFHKFHYLPLDSTIKDNCLEFFMNDVEHRMTFNLKKTDSKILSGTLKQYDKIININFNKISETPTDNNYYVDFERVSPEQRISQLKEHAEYADDSTTIPFTYKLNEGNLYKDIINKYKINDEVKGKTDVELMVALLNVVCDNFPHNGNSKMPEKRDLISVVNYAKENLEGVNCRLLSIILSELCRAYGVPAKHISCLPKEDPCDECHVVVHAYSENLGQWIMLDPTFRLILKNEKNEYVNLSMLRNSLINDLKIIPNENAGHNGSPFSVDDYRSYMTKNTFRFSCATDYYFGAEEGYKKNVANMLIPKNYTQSKKERITTSPRAFWAKP